VRPERAYRRDQRVSAAPAQHHRRRGRPGRRCLDRRLRQQAGKDKGDARRRRRRSARQHGRTPAGDAAVQRSQPGL